MFNTSIGIDLGTSSVVIYVKGKGIVLNEPSVIAYNKEDKMIRAVGHTAHRMLGRNPAEIEVLRPLRNGVISSYTQTEAMIRTFLKRVLRHGMVMPRLMICVPSGVTDVEQRAVIETARQMNMKEIYIMEEPLAAALGAGLDITEAEGKMVVDIGGGTTDISVISSGKSVADRSLKIAGEEFDEAVLNYMKQEHNLIIGPQTAEHIKKTVGCVKKRNDDVSVVARGICNITGMPKSVIVTSEEIRPIFSGLVYNITERINEVLEELSPQLQADVLKSGILLAGGGSLIWGLDSAIYDATGICAYLAEDCFTCVAYGAGKALDFIASKTSDYTKRVYKKAYIHE